MRIRAQIAMVLNLDKCIGCHTCSVTCKNVWTNREGMEYAWFNNVETKPGIGYPKDWENQKRWKGGWTRKRNGKIQPKIGSKWRILACSSTITIASGADSISPRNCCSAARSDSSACLRSVMSELSSMTAIGRPSSSRISAWREETTIRVPSLRV